MKFTPKPLNDYVFFIEEEVRQLASILTPQGGKTDASRSFGRVIAVGPGRINEDGTRIPMTVKVGDLIVLGGANSLVKYGHMDPPRVVRAIREPEVSAIVEEDTGYYTHRAFDGENLCGATRGSQTETERLVTCPRCVEKMAVLVLQ